MNIHPTELRSLKTFARNACRYTFIITVSVYLSVVLAVIYFEFTMYLQGRNTSDVGVRMYENSGVAFLFWLIGCPLLEWVLAFLIKRTISQDSNLPYWFVGIVGFEVWLIRTLWFVFLS